MSRKVLEWTVVIEIVVILSLCFVSFRLVALPFLLLCAGLLISMGRHRREGWLHLSCVLAVAALLQPVDVLRGTHHGYGKGPRLVRYAGGTPRHTKLITTYGEYVSGGCGSGGPVWIFVWK